MPDVVVLGSLNIDLVADVVALPTPGETVLAHGLHEHGGGKGANQAVAAARLGASVAMVGAVGSDKRGAALRAGLEAEGVDTTAVRSAATGTGVALILVDRDGENVIVVAPGANGSVDADDATRAAGLLRPGSVLLCQLEIPTTPVRLAARTARDRGALVILNASPASDVPADLLRNVDVLVVNAGEAQAVLGRPVTTARQAAVAAAELNRLVGAVALTLGAQGVVLADRSGVTSVPAFPVRAVDTVGAGDAFVGALACELARGSTLRGAATVGVAAGALAACRPGAQESLPFRADVEALLRSGDEHNGKHTTAAALERGDDHAS